MSGIGNVNGLNKYSYIVFTFPQTYSFSSTSVAVNPNTITGSTEVYNNIIIFRFNVDITVNSLTFTFSSLTNSLA